MLFILVCCMNEYIHSFTYRKKKISSSRPISCKWPPSLFSIEQKKRTEKQRKIRVVDILLTRLGHRWALNLWAREKEKGPDKIQFRPLLFFDHCQKEMQNRGWKRTNPGNWLKAAQANWNSLKTTRKGIQITQNCYCCLIIAWFWLASGRRSCSEQTSHEFCQTQLFTNNDKKMLCGSSRNANKNAYKTQARATWHFSFG